jgi:lysozyme family protein
VGDLYNKNYNTLKKEIEKDYKKMKNLPCPWIDRINIAKMAILPKAIYMSVQSPTKFQWFLLQRLKKQP